jgi:DNA polymerase-3 subunit delta
LQYHGLNDHSPKNVASVLKINPYFVGEYQTAARNFPMKRVSQIIANLRELDLKGKGVNASSMDQSDLLKELLYRIL